MLEVKELNVYYNKQVLYDLSFHLHRGEILGIAGESGSGKSTLLKTLLLLNDNYKGTMLFKGKNIDETCRGKHIGIVFQDTSKHLVPVQTIEKQLIEFVQTHTSKTRQEVMNEAIELLELMDFKEPARILKSYPHELSGGMIQRVGIMFAMILKPEILLLDEPTSALDVVSQHLVLKEIKKLNTYYQTSIIIVTHNLSVIDYVCDTCMILKEGKVVEEGNKDQLFLHPQTDYFKQLLEARLKVKIC